MAKKFDIEDWKARRQRCRTDLRYLCGVLGYRDVGKPHKAMIEHCQKFKGGTEPLNQIRIKDGAGYTPLVPLWELQGKRKRLRLVTRGGLKTSILTQAEKIQFELNYPDIRIALGSAQLSRSKDFLKAIKEQHLKNEIFRWLFPEYCPKTTESGKLEDFGNDEQFTVPCRRTVGIKEPTYRIFSADSSVAGGHYDVGDVDDGVEDQNTRTPMSIEQTKRFFASLWPLIETSALPPGHGWFHWTGTIYSFSDAHFSLMAEEMKKPEKLREWEILCIPANDDWPTCSAAMEKLERAEASGIQDDIDRMREHVDKLDKEHSWWPQRIGIRHLRKIEKDPALGPSVLYPQYLLKPLQDKNGLITSRDDIRWISRRELNNIKPRITAAGGWNCTVDLAGMGTSAGADADHEALNLHGWGTDGRCYFDRIVWGRLSPEQVIDEMFSIFSYCPKLMYFKIEAEAHSRVLAPFLLKEMSRRGVYLPIMEIKRDNSQSKAHRIRGTQPYWKNAFVFADDIPDDTKEQLILEALYFPKFNHDDILDTCADALQSRDGVVPEVQGRETNMLPDLTYTKDGQAKEWRGIPVGNIPAHVFAGLDEGESFANITEEWTN